MKKVALIGLGRHGKNILKEISNLGINLVVVFHNKDAENEKWLIENFPLSSFTYNIEDIVNDPTIEAVIIATPMSTHVSIANMFSISNKRVFIEKPLSNSSKLAKDLYESFSNNNTQFMVGHVFLYHNCFLKLKELLKDKSISEVKAVKTSRNPELPHSSKELFLDSFIHELSIFVGLFGLPKDVSYDKESIQLVVNYSDFNIASKIINMSKDEKIRKFEFITNQETYVWQNDDLIELSTGNILAKPDRPTLQKEFNIFLNEYDKWSDVIKENNKISLYLVESLEEVYNRI